MTSKIDKIISVSVETSGYDAHSLNKADGYQILSFGMVAANPEDYKEIDSVYAEVKWNGTSRWNASLESMHGFTKQYLENSNRAITEEQAAAVIANYFLTHFPDKPVVLLGHNVSNFAYWFIKSILDKYTIDIPLSARVMDTFTVGKLLFNLDDSHEIFEMLQRTGRLNAIEKAETYLQFMRVSRELAKHGGIE